MSYSKTDSTNTHTMGSLSNQPNGSVNSGFSNLSNYKGQNNLNDSINVGQYSNQNQKSQSAPPNLKR